MSLLAGLIAAGSASAAAGPGQVGAPVRWLPLAPADPVTGAQGYYAGQSSAGDGVVLTASNGFFTRGLRAEGAYPVPDTAAHGFIAADFATLSGWAPGMEARWHLFVRHPGELRLTPGPSVPGKGTFSVGIGGETKRISYPANNDAPAIFTIGSAGEVTVTVRPEGADPGATLGDLRLAGPAATDAELLRARWRPAAAHTSYAASGLASPDMWVMTMRSDAPSASYSPITTPFGYYGTTFGADGVCGGGFNFSFWSDTTAPQDRWSHLLAVGSPSAAFGAFGHEGDGVKIRGDRRPLEGKKTVTLALRRESSPPFDTYYAYYFDETAGHWRLYGVGRHAQRKGGPARMNPGSFVEQPGPPAVERSGDLPRLILRKGWVATTGGPWVRLDQMRGGDARRDYANISGGVTADGWFSMGMGGMTHYGDGRPAVTTLPAAFATEKPLFLDDALRPELFELPARWGARSFSSVGRDAATLTLRLKAAGDHAKVTVYYGPADRLTFAENPGYKDVESATWPSHTRAVPAVTGDNTVTLTGLRPGTRYYVRALLENDAGKIWTFETDTFETAKPAGP